MKKTACLFLLAVLTAAPALADSPKYDLATFGAYLVVTVDKSFDPARNMAIRKDTILAVNREDKNIEIITDLYFSEFDREHDSYVDRQKSYHLRAKDEEEAEKLFYRIMEQISG